MDKSKPQISKCIVKSSANFFILIKYKATNLHFALKMISRLHRLADGTTGTCPVPKPLIVHHSFLTVGSQTGVKHKQMLIYANKSNVQTVYYCVNEVVPGVALIRLALSWPCEANAYPSETHTRTSSLR